MTLSQFFQNCGLRPFVRKGQICMAFSHNEYSDGLYIQILVKRTYHISCNEMVSPQSEYVYSDFPV